MVRKALDTLIVVTGFAAAIVAILTAPSLMRRIVLWALLAVAIVLLCLRVVPEVIRWYRARTNVPDPDTVPGQYQVEQASDSDMAFIAELEASVYSRADAIPEPILREWYSANPTGFSLVRSPSGKPIGHLDILPLRPATLDAFLKGDIVEREIRADCIYSVNDRKLITALYVESVILKPEGRRTAAAALICLLQAFPTIIGRIADASSLEKIYAVAATSRGEKLLRELGFGLERSADRRRDGHHLFGARISEVDGNVARRCGSRSVQTVNVSKP
jgi:hypothetical protein